MEEIEQPPKSFFYYLFHPLTGKIVFIIILIGVIMLSFFYGSYYTCEIKSDGIVMEDLSCINSNINKYCLLKDGQYMKDNTILYIKANLSFS